MAALRPSAGLADSDARAAGGETSSKPVQVVRTEANEPYKALTATPRRIASVLAVVLLTFFFMVYGESLQRNAIALFPTRQQKKLTVVFVTRSIHEAVFLSTRVVMMAARPGRITEEVRIDVTPRALAAARRHAVPTSIAKRS